MKTGLTVTGLLLDFIGTIALLWGLWTQHAARIKYDQKFTDEMLPHWWSWRGFPHRVADKFGSSDVTKMQEAFSESFPTLFWAMLSLGLGFILQIVSALL